MTRVFVALSSLALALGLAAPAPALADHHAEKTSAALINAGERWKQLYEAGDWETLRSLYTDDAVLMSQGQPKLEGADTILTFLQRLSQQGATVTFQFAPEEAVIESGMGVVTAKYRMDIAFPGAEPAVVAGRSLLIYKWQDGAWKLWRDIDNFAPDVTPDNFETRGAT
ncbi:MAG: DUF4440 domain-containing protein [Pseudomonadota bacterium]